MLVRPVKFLSDATIPYEDWMKNLDEKVNVGHSSMHKSGIYGGRDYSHTWIITEMSHPTIYFKLWLWWHDLHPAPDPRRVVLLGILGGGWCAVLRILTLLQTKKCYFPHPFSEQISKIHTHFRTWPNLACSTLSDSWGDSPVFSVLFSCSRFLNSADPAISEPGTG